MLSLVARLTLLGSSFLLAACGSDGTDGRAGRSPAATPSPAPVDAAVRPPTPQQAERLRVALATNIDPSLSRRYERVAPLAVEGCRTMRRDPAGSTWDATVQASFREAGFADFSLGDASLFLEILRSDYCPITG